MFLPALPSAPYVTELPWQPPEQLFPLCRDEDNSVFLDSGGPAEQDRHRWSFLCPRPAGQLILPLAKMHLFPQHLRQFLADHTPVNGPSTPFPNLPFVGGVIGLLSYEAGMAREGLTSRHETDCPAFNALACRDLFIFDRLERRLWWASADGLPAPDLPPTTAPSAAPQLRITPVAEQDATTWQAAVQTVRDYIAAGDIFQANLTMRWVATRPEGLDLHDLYEQLRTTCPAPFGAWFHTPDFTLLSASVERFLSLNRQGQIETRPIKGTCPISPDPQKNDALKDALRHDEKELAENLMITDLMRHDIGRVCQLGSVEVPQLFAVERFAHVHHLVSSITGQLQAGYDAADLLAATIPPGSVTGAPKYRAMEIIDEVETSARGAYCGTLFRLGWDGALDSAVIIRSISATSHYLRVGAGGGITYPSHPEREYDEMCLKAAPLLDVLHRYGH
ncbi:anthranilate synthase component I family protein [Bombella sp. TMW 2.2543]|uniref:Anthranilate synthase component I family protein n=1 Tax=Bombella pluederhausensis TaxID=2967336 RepID=A0ABT3WKE0_9PROT|nr:anthranilate synthase component I family protein [Bombella pluederhausensis]MCX5618645.1 anthranilate synthase component I family protein [Bombella pluederhausensis]